MSNIKDLFRAFRTQKTLVSKSLNDLEPGVESSNFTDSTLRLQKETDPYIDFSDPENFVFYGSAEQYYRDAFSYIKDEFPYDGSGKEKIEWELSASAFDKYIYEQKYPRTNGYVTIGKDATALAWLPTGDRNSTGYAQPSRTEFISFKGGPHPAPQVKAGEKVSKFFPSRKGGTPGANLYNTTINQQSNLEIDGARGISVEFWLNKQSYDSDSESYRQVVCDLWNSGSWVSGSGASSTYGRFRVEISGSSTEDAMLPNFHVELLSGSSGFSAPALPGYSLISGSNPTLIMSGTSLTGSWNHFALTFINDESQMTGKLYQNGSPVYSLTTGSSIGLITGSMLGQIGSLIAPVSGAKAQKGYGLLSASLDEFRFWKTKRTGQQIGLNWFTQINGGTNTDIKYDYNAPTKYNFTNPVDLGVYYKFNEGITNVNSTDLTVLDYSGRITNGSWTGYGEATNQRSTGSAIVEAAASSFEYKDPILYSYHPRVNAKLNELVLTGSNYDINNNASIFQSLPDWIQDEDRINDRNILLKLTQIIASYFDRLQIQIQRLPRIRDVNYVSSSFKPFPYADRLIDSTGLTSTELFSEATALEKLVSRDDFRLFSKKFDDTKNRIYHNIYNNLVYILKSKGTEKSFRNLIRCYGVGEELVKLNLYGDQVTYAIKENFESTITRKRFANFNTTSSFNASVYQSTGSTVAAYKRSYLSSSVNASYQGNTFEVEAIFPRRTTESETNNFYVPFEGGSLFGVHTVVTGSNPNQNTWAKHDVANFQVSSVRSGLSDKDAYFKLTGSAGGSFPLLTSSIQKDVYDNKRWNLAVRIKPTSYPWAAGVSGSDTTTYDIEFLGYNTILDSVENEFKVTGTISKVAGQNFLSSSKRAFVGAHRTNFTGTVLQQSDARIGSVKYWYDYLDDKTILAHAKDPSNSGRYHPGRNTFINQYNKHFGSGVISVPQIETLALHWNFDLVTGSNVDGEFEVADYSSGSVVGASSSYGWLSQIASLQHPGKGVDFPSNNIDAAIREYVYTAKQQPPEILNSSGMIEIKSEGDTEIFTTDTRPIKYFATVEKSMNAIISSEMIKLFATVLDFNNLIGEPVNRYRQDYKALEKMRELFFRRVKNETVDFEKFIDYYKWIDASITILLTQLFPISSNFSNKIFNMIESHVLERNKYWTKFPTLETKAADPEAGVKGISEMLYSGKRGIAPLPASTTGSNCEWWLQRTERNNPNITSGDLTLDNQRDKFKLVSDFRSGSGPTLSTVGGVQYQAQAYALRNFTKIYRFAVDELPEIHGGSNFPRAKKIQYTHDALKFDSSEQLEIAASSVVHEKDCNDVIDPSAKNRLEHKLRNTSDLNGYISGKGTIFSPFSLFSSSAGGGYLSEISTNFRKETDITNYHDDSYGDDKEIPLQGPFTERHVGGRQHRHIDINTASTDTNLNRPEAWVLSFASNAITISQRNVTGQPHHPRATMLRDETAKRPVNIRNIKWGTSSAVAGNYRKDYEIVQTSGRTLNNRFFVKNEGFGPSVNVSPYVSGVIDFELPRNDITGTNKFIFVERFSAPGGPEVSSRGALDVYAEEYSVYNELNQRNLIVRNALHSWHTEHCGQFGIKSGSFVNAAGYDGMNAAYHKVNRNSRKIASLTTGFAGAQTCSVNYDNWFIQHPIPQSDYQYSWITASVSKSACDTFGHYGSGDGGRTNFSIPIGSTSTTASAIPFITQGDEPYAASAAGNPVDFIGINTLIYDPVTSSLGILSASDGNYTNTSIVTITSPNDFNALILHRNGPYQYSSWKQIRTGETPIPRYQRRNNIIAVGPERDVIFMDYKATKKILQREVRDGTITARGGITEGAEGGTAAQGNMRRIFTEPMVTFKYKPLDTTFQSGFVWPFTERAKSQVKHTFCNNLYFFANPHQELLKGFGLPESYYPNPSYVPAAGDKRPSQMHDAIYAQYVDEPTRFDQIIYSEVIYPKAENTSLNKIRSRVQYEESAPVGPNNYAVADYGRTGIDRDSLRRRSFWSNRW